MGVRMVLALAAVNAMAGIATPQSPQLSKPVPETMFADARLADVCFVDAMHGWAVGDRGAILHTADGGKTWRRQRSGVDCPLRSVCFIDSRAGWAAGGFSHPYTHGSSAVLLLTDDGGRHWRPCSQPLMPGLRKIRFFDSKRGWAIGDGSETAPSGAFITDSGGRSWRPVTSGESPGWLAGDFTDPHNGVLAGRDGTISAVRKTALEPTRTGSLGLRKLRALELVQRVYGWLAGDAGLLMMTADAGMSWQTPPGQLSTVVVGNFDFAALSVRGPKVWVAGTPGSRVFHSPDAGRTWHAFPTGVSTPIHSLCFIDDQHGWAVGELGTILATRDGGQSWQVQRAGGTRAAMLGIYSTERDIPLELVARLCGEDGYLGAVELLNRRDIENKPRRKTHSTDRAGEAVAAVGGCSVDAAWQFPLRQEGLRLGEETIVDAWNRVNDSRGMRQLEAYVVRRIRMWRPEIVFTHDASPRGDDPTAHLINQVVLRAVELAADPTYFSEQITHAGLEPWRVKKVYASLPDGQRGSNNLVTAQLAVRLGDSLDEVAAGPRGLIEEQFTVAQQALGFRLLLNRLPEDQGRRDFFSGISLRPGGEARRQLENPRSETLELLRRTTQKRRNMQAILQRTGQDHRGGLQLLAQSGKLTDGLDSSSAGRILYHLAQRYYVSGQWAMAAETFQMLVDSYPNHTLARPSVLWLTQYYASGEAAWRVNGSQRYSVHQASHRDSSDRSTPAVDFTKQEDRPAIAARWGKRIEQTMPDLFSDPKLRFPLAVAHRSQGFPRHGERFFVAHSRAGGENANGNDVGGNRLNGNPWQVCAAGELWLAKPEGIAPKKIMHCAVAREKPRLDGKLDDKVWTVAKKVQLRSAMGEDGAWPAVTMLAYDNEFLYIAAKCRRAPGVKYEQHTGARERDGDLSAFDRIDVLLDIDRDFSTYYRLTMDHRGCPAEQCWGDKSWDPTWFVAADKTDSEWTVEAAVPLDQLGGTFPSGRSAWAVGIQRTVPGAGFQSWTTPAAVSPIGEGFGYLIFE